jgi:tetratricopeptide (TPR) repeat protein
MPDNDVYKSEQANSLGQLAISEMSLGHLDKARVLFREEVGIRKSFSPARASQRERRRELAGLFEKLGELSLCLRDRPEAVRYYDESEEIRRDMAAENPNNWPFANDVALSHMHAATLRFPYGDDPNSARGFYLKAISIYERRVRTDPIDLDAKARLAQAVYYEAICALHAGDTEAATSGFRRCLDIYKLLASEPRAQLSQGDFMLALARCGEHAEAAKIARSLVSSPTANERNHYLSACGYALAAAAKGDARLARRYTDAALDCLHESQKRGLSQTGR